MSKDLLAYKEALAELVSSQNELLGFVKQVLLDVIEYRRQYSWRPVLPREVEDGQKLTANIRMAISSIDKQQGNEPNCNTCPDFSECFFGNLIRCPWGHR